MEFRIGRSSSTTVFLPVIACCASFPAIGYNFKEKEFYWRVRSDFDYWPRKRAALHLEFGNGNRIYSSDVLDDLKAIPDSIF